MSRIKTNLRHLDRTPVVDPWFSGGVIPGYSQADSLDPTGYSLRDPGAQAVLAGTDGGFGPLPESYGDEVGPVSGGILGEPGACSTSAGLGMPAGKGAWLGGQHAISSAPLEYTAPGERAGTVPEFAVPPSPEGRTKRLGLTDPGARL